ncbi:hypothetical protein CANTEDRAFT_103297 [Yamadazyma tenuis ATCC 10573]|uniref:Importin N-terminal domain-containing protein n=1 Tax=Candida tenuis (strain ATCC 10573 / BCRC 21748 / CBS 615 / JCM 9827 / NBRC 10315 / NRRL Y-1498 / VKM Y-70) TaxID=590646 RepID=G3B1D3_CANTC|nr:uncharacterized protein CANTEDRAFT_103297 [Yamadazyma tenuis ATCC 10573]EGV64943.1 hypothetical protein CANTEDRAFT_103297 [Yamadazyma tenuis ATCC 10573]
MDPQYLTSLEDTLKQTLVANTATIKQASQKLTKDFYTNPLALPSLFHILQNAQDDQLKQLASVEARKLVYTKWAGVDEGLKSQIRSAMLNNTFTQSSKLIRHSSARVVAAIAEMDLDEKKWPELLPTLIENVQSEDVQTKEMAVFTLYTILETQSSSLLDLTSDFLNLFSSLLTDVTSRSVRVNAVLAFDTLAAFLENLPSIDAQTANKFKSCIPLMVNVLREVIQADEIEMAKDIFNVFNSLIFVENKLMGNHLIDLIKLSGELAINIELDEEIRVFALQFLISSVNMRKSKVLSSNVGPDMTLIGLKVASEEIDIEEELENEEDENENEENAPPTLGLRLLAMLSAELPPSHVITPIFENIPAMLSSSDQFQRRAAILSLGVASAGSPDYIAGQINKVVPALVSGLKDPEVVVRIAALKALAELTSELQDTITAFHEQFLPLLIDIIDSATSVGVYKHACVALDGLIEFLGHDSIETYLEPLIKKLLVMLQQAHSSTLKSTIVSAIGSTAYAAGKKFIPYFNDSIQYLEPFVVAAAETEGLTEDDIELRALTFENISTMARAVGKDAFARFANPLAEAAYQALGSEHSRMRESGFAFISNIAKVYGEDFVGFLDKIVPEIFKCLEQEEFTFNLDEEDDELDDDDDLANKFNVNTGITYEKEVAAVALGELASGTGKHFYKYVEQSVKVLMEQVENSYGMREAAMSILWKIVRASFVAEHGEHFKYPKGIPKSVYINGSIHDLIKNVRSLSIENLKEEYEITMVACILGKFDEAISEFGAIAILDPTDTESLSELCGQIMEILTKKHPCQVDDDEVPNDEQEASETEVVLFDSALEVLVNLGVALGPDFGKIFNSFKEVIFQNVTSKSKTKRITAAGCLAELASVLSGDAALSQQLMEIFVNRLGNDTSIDVKANAAYGIGLIVENSDVDFTSAYNSILEMLFHLLSKTDKQATDADDEETKEVINRSYANACGCVARMALKNENAVPLQHIMTPLLSHLPLEASYEDNTPVLNLILRLYETNNELITSQTDKVVDILAKIFAKEADFKQMQETSTLGREENLDRMKQFETPELKQKVIDLLRFIEQKYAGLVSGNESLKTVI